MGTAATFRMCVYEAEGMQGSNRFPGGERTTNVGGSPQRPAAQRQRQRCVTEATSATTSAMAESWAATIGSWRVRESDEDGRWDRETSSTSRRQALSGIGMTSMSGSVDSEDSGIIATARP